MSEPVTKTLKAGYLYTVTASTTCTVSTGDGLVIITVEPGTQGSFVAPVPEIVFSDPDALVTATFKGASAAVAGGGGISRAQMDAAISKVDTCVVDFGTVTTTLDLSGYTIDTTDRTAPTDELWFEFGGTAHQITWPSTWIWLEGEEPDLAANTAYCVCVRQERSNRIIANLAYEYSTTGA